MRHALPPNPEADEQGDLMMATEQIDSTQFHYVQVMAIADIAAQLFCNHLLERDARLKQRVCGDGGQQERKLMWTCRSAKSWRASFAQDKGGAAR